MCAEFQMRITRLRWTHEFGYSHHSMTSRYRAIPSATHSVDPARLRATAAGTASYADRFAAGFTTEFFRLSTFGVTLSSIGIGTYLGDANDAVDEAYIDSVTHAVQRGVNLIDAAINYRSQRSERAVGTAIQRLLSAGKTARDELVVCSKAGYVPLSDAPISTREEYRAYVQREFIDPQILRPEEIVAGGHSLAPRFLRYCLAKTRQNLGLRAVDIYYLHNPEQQLAGLGVAELDGRLCSAFEFLEEAVGRGEIGVYGVSTWEGLRTPPGSKSHLGLERMVAIAREVAGDSHNCRVVQLPVNLAMTEGIRENTQPTRDGFGTAVQVAADHGMTVIASAPLMQAKLATGLPPALGSHFPGCTTDAQRALEFARTAPGVTSALVGMSKTTHVDENLHVATK